MSLLFLGELFAAYMAFAGLLAVLVLAAAIARYGNVPLLDGTRLGGALDDCDRGRHLLDLAIAEDREVEALDALWDLPARRHP